MKKIFTLIAVASMIAAFAGPPAPRSHGSHPAPRPHGPRAVYIGPAPRPHLPAPRHHHHHHHHSGRDVAAGIGIGLGLSLLSPYTMSPPPPPPRPYPYRPLVWVPPVYETRPVYDAFGNIIRYEQVMVRAGYWR